MCWRNIESIICRPDFPPARRGLRPVVPQNQPFCLLTSSALRSSIGISFNPSRNIQSNETKAAPRRTERHYPSLANAFRLCPDFVRNIPVKVVRSVQQSPDLSRRVASSVRGTVCDDRVRHSMLAQLPGGEFGTLISGRVSATHT